MAGNGSCCCYGVSGGRQSGDPNPKPADSIAAPTWNTLTSSYVRPTICTPVGTPFAAKSGRHGENRAPAEEVERQRHHRHDVVHDRVSVDLDLFVDVWVAGLQTGGCDRRAQHDVDVFEQAAEWVPERRLFDEALIEGQIRLHAGEGPGVVGQRIAVLGFDRADAWCEDRPEMGPGSVPDSLGRPRQGHLVDLCSGLT